MNQKLINKILPYVVAGVTFLLITWIYFHPLFEGNRVRQGDNINYIGMSKEIKDYRASTGEEALWTNSMFGGMPAYQISVNYKGNLMRFFDRLFVLNMPTPAGLFFLYMAGFFILLLVLGADPWLSLVGAIAFGLSSYLIIIIEAGHNSKVHAIGYMAPVLAGIILTLRGRYLLGGSLTALFLALELNAGHPQIAYYLFIIILFLLTGEFINSLRNKSLTSFGKPAAVMLTAGIIAILPNLTSIWATYQYGKYTIRGKTELSSEKHNRTSGLDKDYATDWSYGVAESFSLMIPNVKGGASQAIGNNETALKNVDPQYKETIASSGNQYWGDQPFTSGPVYAGAIIMFLFILGLFTVKGRLKWILLIVTVLSIMLGWGKNFWALTNFFLDYVPLYNKFRAVSMTLVIAEITIPVLAILGLNEILKNPDIISKKQRYFYISFGLTGGLCLLFYLLPTAFFSFLSSEEVREIASQKSRSPEYAEQISAVYANLEIARTAIFKADAIRSFMFIFSGAAAIWLFAFKKIKKPVLIVAMILLVFIDMYIVDRRYLNEKNFVEKIEMQVPFQASKADEFILKDKSPNFRVLNMTVSTFNDASTSYFHKSIGGYHGAKLRRYQEIIENCLSQEMAMLKGTMSNKANELSVSMILRNTPVLNMLNTKYIIYNPGSEPLENNFALGNAWFVEKYMMVNNADEEIKAVGSFEPSSTAVIDKRFKDKLNNLVLSGKDTTATIKLTEYKPNYLAYDSKSSKEGLAVFSEIYYDKGWEAMIDGKPATYLRVNYILRAMTIPAGEHKIEFSFKPKVYYTGEKISLAGSLILIISLFAALFVEGRRKKVSG